MAGIAMLAAVDGMPPLFALLAVMLVSVVLVSLLLLRFQQSLLVAYFCCGILIANAGIMNHFGGGSSREAVQQMANFGVVLLMFVIGLEFSVSELRFLRRYALTGGGLQMGTCLLITVALARLGGLPWNAAIVLAVTLAMSSTAISLKTLQDMELSNSRGARFALGVAILQDLFIIAFLVLLPLILGSGGKEKAWTAELGWLALRGTGFVALAAVSARWIIPAVLQAVARTRSRELFTLAMMGCCLGLAFVAGLLELSLALGAFVAGLAVSETVFKHRILADILPIKDVFLTLFFVSVGLLIDLHLALKNIWLILGLTLALTTGKTATITAIAWHLGLSNRQALLGALSLASAGEFSLLLLQDPGVGPLWPADLQQSLVAASALSMGLVPFLVRLADPVAEWLNARKLGPSTSPRQVEAVPIRQRVKELKGHAIICGHGVVGSALNQTLRDAGIPTLIVEMNVDTVRQLMREEQAVLFADAAHEETWHLARLPDADLVAFTFPDATTTAAALHHIHEINPEVGVIARARFAPDLARLERLGVQAVIHDEREAAAAAVTQTLRLLGNRRHLRGSR
ncbi:MAG: monovalent cation:H+ antiporter-2, CPA2 family [Verrucomicrobia bacterium]|nr:MAG: monovalent cation:H+ antiporter-2, CPA2 family [Verrucomicrobiota bacterium]